MPAVVNLYPRLPEAYAGKLEIGMLQCQSIPKNDLTHMAIVQRHSVLCHYQVIKKMSENELAFL